MESGQFRTLYQGSSIPAIIAAGYARTDTMGNTAYAANTATCDASGAVETFGGTWSYQYDPFCPRHDGRARRVQLPGVVGVVQDSDGVALRLTASA